MASRSAEDELFDLFTDDEVKQALEDLPENFRIARAARRRRGLLVQGDRRDPRHPDRHGDVPAASGKKGDAEAVVRLRHRARAARTAAAPGADDRARTKHRSMADCNETLRELEQFLDDELSDDGPRGDPRPPRRVRPTACEAFDFHAELRMVIAAKCRNDELPPGLLARSSSASATTQPAPDRVRTATFGRHARQHLALVDRCGADVRRRPRRHRPDRRLRAQGRRPAVPGQAQHRRSERRP